MSVVGVDLVNPGRVLEQLDLLESVLEAHVLARIHGRFAQADQVDWETLAFERDNFSAREGRNSLGGLEGFTSSNEDNLEAVGNPNNEILSLDREGPLRKVEILGSIQASPSLGELSLEGGTQGQDRPPIE